MHLPYQILHHLHAPAPHLSPAHPLNLRSIHLPPNMCPPLQPLVPTLPRLSLICNRISLLAWIVPIPVIPKTPLNPSHWVCSPSVTLLTVFLTTNVHSRIAPFLQVTAPQPMLSSHSMTHLLPFPCHRILLTRRPTVTILTRSTCTYLTSVHLTRLHQCVSSRLMLLRLHCIATQLLIASRICLRSFSITP